MAASSLRFGVFLPAYVWPGEPPPTATFLQDFARRAEDLGFDGVWVFCSTPLPPTASCSSSR